MHYRSYRWLVTVILLSTLLSGCAVKMVYNRLDWLIPWYISDYVSFTGDQRSFFQQRLADHLAWHRNEQLPQYADLLERVASDLDTGLSSAAIAAYQNEVEQITRIIVARVAPDLITLFVEADDEQLQQLFAKFEDDNKEYLKRFIEQSEARVRADRASKVIRGIQRWTGRLSREQRALVQVWSETYPSMVEEFLDTRLTWQQALQDALQHREDHEVFAEHIYALLNSEGFGRSEVFEQKLAQNRVLLRTLYSEIHSSLTSAQRERAVARMRGYARDFRDLSAR